MEKVFPDSNVLYPISVANLTLRLGDLKIHEVLWSEDLLGEVERVHTGQSPRPRSLTFTIYFRVDYSEVDKGCCLQ